METAMGLNDWVLALILGGILGMTGQGIRVVIGLKKLHKKAFDEKKQFKEVFQSTELILSLLIGFMAGSLAIIGISGGDGVVNPNKELFITILGAGYAGTDFIEGFISKYLPKNKATP